MIVGIGACPPRNFFKAITALEKWLYQPKGDEKKSKKERSSNGPQFGFLVMSGCFVIMNSVKLKTKELSENHWPIL